MSRAATYIGPVAFDHVDQVVCCGVVPQGDVGVVDAVLAENGLDEVSVQLRLRDHGLQVKAALLFPLENNIWRGLVEPNSKPFQLCKYE